MFPMSFYFYTLINDLMQISYTDFRIVCHILFNSFYKRGIAVFKVNQSEL